MSLVLSFDCDVAMFYGLDEAIMIKYFQVWIAKNKANNMHFHNGRTWTYNSRSAFSKLFPFWKEHKIYRIIQSLISQEVIIKGNFHVDCMDRTVWYTFKDDETTHFANMHNALCKCAQCIVQSSAMYIRNNITNKDNITNNKEKYIKKKNDEKYINTEKIREEAKELIIFINDLTGRSFRPVIATLAPIMARLKDGASLQQCKTIIARMHTEWSGDKKMEEYIRPSTLFRPSNFENYLSKCNLEKNHDDEM